MKTLRHTDHVHRQLKSKEGKEEFSRSAILSEALGSKDFFIHHEILAPGKRASSPHFHQQTDEFVFVLKGRATAIEGVQALELGPGDSALFAADSGVLHFLENRSSEDVEFLVVSLRLAEPDVSYSSNEKE